jgi:hypothetical protein
MNGVRKPIITPRCTRKGLKGGMTRGLRRRVSLWEISYYFLIPG